MSSYQVSIYCWRSILNPLNAKSETYRMYISSSGLCMESVIFLTILILLLPKNRRRVLTGQVSPHVLVTIQIFSTIFTLCTIPRPEYLSLVEIPFPPLTVLTLVSTARPELFHPQVTVLPPLLPTTQHLSDINKEKDSLAIKLLGTQVDVI